MNDALRIQDLEQHVLVNRQTNQRRYDRMRAALTSLGEDRALGYDMALDALIALAGRGSENLSAGAPDGALLDWLERHSVVIEYGDEEEGTRDVTIIHGNVNDRQYTTVGSGPTVRAALREAVLAERSEATKNHSPSDSPSPPTVSPVGDRDAMRDELFEEEAETCDHEGPPLLATGLRFECEREPGHDGPHSAFSRDEDRVEWDNDGNILRDPRREFSAPVGDQETPR